MSKRLFTWIFVALLISVGGVTALLMRAEPATKEGNIPGFLSSNSPTPFVSFTPKPTATPRLSSTATPVPTSSGSTVLISGVPFAAQAPFGEWSDSRFQDGCEEASSIIAVSWARGQSLTPERMRNEIIAISAWEEQNYGSYHDTSAQDTAGRILKGYFGHQNVSVKYDIGADDIRAEIDKGNLVITPMDGQALGNPYFTPPGPERHMVVVIGYDSKTDEFITNDPGTRSGKNFRYSSFSLVSAIRDYPTGNHIPITSHRTAMIVVSK